MNKLATLSVFMLTLAWGSNAFTTTPATVKKQPKPQVLRVAVLDFTTIDIKGSKRFLNHKNKKFDVPAQNSLNNKDRKSVNSIMQGLVRIIDAWDNTKTQKAERVFQAADKNRDYVKTLALYNKVVKGQSRPTVIGADYLMAYLGRRNDVFNCIAATQITGAMQKLQTRPDFPKDFMLKLAKETGATHLIYGVVSDLRSKQSSFKGYGIETKTTNYQLDVIIKVADLVKQQIVYSNVYTGNYREQRPVSGSLIDNNIFQNLMTSALEQAAEDLYEQAKPDSKNRISVTPITGK